MKLSLGFAISDSLQFSVVRFAMGRLIRSAGLTANTGMMSSPWQRDAEGKDPAQDRVLCLKKFESLREPPPDGSSRAEYTGAEQHQGAGLGGSRGVHGTDEVQTGG